MLLLLAADAGMVGCKVEGIVAMGAAVGTTTVGAIRTTTGCVCTIRTGDGRLGDEISTGDAARTLTRGFAAAGMAPRCGGVSGCWSAHGSCGAPCTEARDAVGADGDGPVAPRSCEPMPAGSAPAELSAAALGPSLWLRVFRGRRPQPPCLLCRASLGFSKHEAADERKDPHEMCRTTPTELDFVETQSRSRSPIEEAIAEPGVAQALDTTSMLPWPLLCPKFGTPSRGESMLSISAAQFMPNLSRRPLAALRMAMRSNAVPKPSSRNTVLNSLESATSGRSARYIPSPRKRAFRTSIHCSADICGASCTDMS
mmetsp:Transcript_16269/g.46285  ORF Transcript_16269/g.46285 Transcript_16269/m.46285 type:complete len:313 (-) Transcript_16269:205-1143(-)